MPRAWRSCLSSWSNPVIIRGILCAIGVRQTMAQWDAPSPTLLRLILRYGFAVLSVAIAPALSSYPKIKTRK